MTARSRRPSVADFSDRFAGATYDPTSHYRAAAVFDFFDRQGLDADVLRAVSKHQVGLLMAVFDELDLDPELARRDRSVSLQAVGGFLALTSPRAESLHNALAERGVPPDFRGELLRFGPAPYLSDRQVTDSMHHLGEVAAAL